MKEKANQKYLFFIVLLIVLILVVIGTILIFVAKNKEVSSDDLENVSYLCKKEKVSNGVESFEEQYSFAYSLKNRKVANGESRIVVYFENQETFDSSNLFETFAKQNVPNVVTKDNVSLTHTIAWKNILLSDTENDLDSYLKYLETLDYACEK